MKNAALFMYMKNLPIMKRGKVTGLANVVNSASADLSIATMGIGIQVVSQSYCEFNLAHETNENLQHMPVLGIVGRRVRDIVYTTSGGVPYKPQRSSPSQTMSNRAKRLHVINFLLHRRQRVYEAF